MAKKLKQLLVLVLVVALTATLAISGTVAYLTDRDSAANVFTVGDVSIDLNEDFETGAELIPGVDIEKKPTITNTGKNDAWVWVDIAIPAALDNDDASKNVVHFNMSADSVEEGQWTWWEDASRTKWRKKCNVDIKGVAYNVFTVLYQTALKPDETTEQPVMYKVYMDKHVDITPDGDMYWVEAGVTTDLKWNVNKDKNGNPVIYVSAYAIQKDTFNTVEEAYDAYIAQWADNGTEWAVPSKIIYTDAEMKEAVALTGPIVLGDSIEGVAYVTKGDTSIDLNGNNLKCNYLQNEGVLTVTGGTMNAGTLADYSNITVGEGAETTYNDVNITSGGGGIGVGNGASVTFNSGSVAVNSASTSGRYLFYAEGSGSEITINGGEFSFSKTLNQKRAYVYAGAGTTVIINGGTFGPASIRDGYTAGILGQGTVIITGGTFGFDPSAWVADGYEAVKSGETWTVSAK